MNFLNRSVRKPLFGSSTTTTSGSNSISSSSSTSAKPLNLQSHQLDKRLWRAIDFLHFVVMFFALYTAIIVATLRNDLSEQ